MAIGACLRQAGISRHDEDDQGPLGNNCFPVGCSRDYRLLVPRLETAAYARELKEGITGTGMLLSSGFSEKTEV